MTEDEKPPHVEVEEVFEAIRQEHEDFEDVRSMLALSEAELDQKLTEQGVDAAALERRAAAREAEIRRETAAALAKVPWWKRITRRIIVLWTAGWILVTAFATHLVDVLQNLEPPLASPTHAAPPSGDDLRKEAFDACDKAEWETCLEKLDEARQFDPESDRRPDVQKARALAKEQLGGKK
jgi:hypothetical protein